MFTTRVLQAARQIMKVHPVKALEDNYMYLVCDKNNKGFVVDPVEPDKIQEVADKLKIKIEAALVTHHHYDHAGGMIDFNKIHPEAPIYGGDDRIDKLTNKVETGSKFNVGEMNVNCYSTPCHTRGHICFFVTSDDNDPVVFTGDTLFIAGCGKFFEGTAEEMDKNLNETLANLPGETQVYCGHEYTTSNLKFAHHIEPGNQAVKERLKHSMELDKSHTPTVPSTIAEEKEINPFMRVHSEEIKKNVGATDPVEVMKRLREAKNSYKASI